MVATGVVGQWVVVSIARDLAIEALDVVVRYGSVVIGLACAELPVANVEAYAGGRVSWLLGLANGSQHCGRQSRLTTTSPHPRPAYLPSGLTAQPESLATAHSPHPLWQLEHPFVQPASEGHAINLQRTIVHCDTLDEPRAILPINTPNYAVTVHPLPGAATSFFRGHGTARSYINRAACRLPYHTTATTAR